MNPILYEKISYPPIYTSLDFSKNGIGVLTDCIECLVTEERNGVYEATFKYPITGAHYSDIQPGRVIQVSHDDNMDLQLFTIYGRSAPTNGIVSFFCHHVSYHLSKIFMKPFYAVGLAAVFDKFTWPQYRYAGYDLNLSFRFTTDNTAAGYLDYIADRRPVSIRKVLYDALEVFGGEYEFDNFIVKNLVSRGTNTGVVLRYGKDVIDLTQKEDSNGYYDHIIGYWIGGDGVRVEGEATGTGQSITACGAVDFTNAFSTQPTSQQVTDMAQTYIDSMHPWLPKVNLKVDFVALWQTEEYKDIVPVTKLKLCDTVTVSYPELGVETQAKITKVVWDALLERYSEMIIGDEQNSLAQTVVNQAHTEVNRWLNADIFTSGVADIITANSTNATISSASYRQYGKVAQIYIVWKNVNAISVPADGNVTNLIVGTLVSGKQPGITSCAVSKGDNGGQAWYAVDTGGQIHLTACEGTGTSRTIAAGTQFEIFATFILP